MRSHLIALALSGALLAAPAAATQPATASTPTLPSLDDLPSPTLPDAAAVATALREAPMVQSAGAMRDAARRRGDALRSGTQEFNLQLQTQSRRVTAAPDSGTYQEWQVLLSRPLRWPGQAAADAQVAATGESLAAVGLGDAAHEARRQVLQLWFDARRSAAIAALQSQAAALMEQQRAAMERRRALGDASQLELDQVTAEAAREQAAATLAQGQADAAAAQLASRLPGLEGAATVPAAPATDVDDATLLADILAHSHELAMARAGVKQAQALTAQADANRRPQPTAGVYVGRERGGAERLIGLQLGIPLGSSARTAQADAEAAAARAAQWQARDVEQRLTAQLKALLAQRDALRASATAMSQAGRAQVDAARRMQIAYARGEASLSDWLLLRRSALQAMQDALGARFDAAGLDARLRLDAALLWDDGQGPN